MTFASYDRHWVEQSTPSTKKRQSRSQKQISHYQYFNGQKDSIESPYFKNEIRRKAEIPSKKQNFISSLITKLKSVQRPHDKSILSKQPSKHILADVTMHAQKERLENSSKLIQKYQYQRFNTDIRKNCETKSQKMDLYELQQQNCILKAKMNELIIENQRLKIKMNQFMKAEAEITKREEALKQRENALSENQTFLLSFQSLDLCNQHKVPHNKLAEMSFSNLKIHNEFKLAITKVVDEVILPTQNTQLKKAYQDIKQLNHQKLQLERKCIASLSQYRRTKADELQNMKKSFANNLNHYKQLICKLSIKQSPPQIKRYQQDTLQTFILESSSIDQE